MGCAAHTLSDGAEAVRILDSEPENCTFIGEVVGSQGNWLTADYTSDKNILVGARNQAKNQAAAIGANVIVIKKSVDNSNEGVSAYGDSDFLEFQVPRALIAAHSLVMHLNAQKWNAIDRK